MPSSPCHFCHRCASLCSIWGGRGAGRTSLLLALVVWLLTTRPLRDRALFLIVLETSNNWVLMAFFSYIFACLSHSTMTTNPFGDGAPLIPAPNRDTPNMWAPISLFSYITGVVQFKIPFEQASIAALFSVLLLSQISFIQVSV